MTLGTVLSDTVRLARTWLRTGRTSRANAELFDGVEHYCMFIGYPRSGHTLIGALLDAHPDAVIGHETAAMQHVRAGFDRNRLYQMILDTALEGGDRRWVSSGEYVYHVDGMWQGRYRSLRVIGDKQAEGATLRIGGRPELLDRVLAKLHDPRVVHVVRNPYDNVTTMATRAVLQGGGEPDLRLALDRYRHLCATATQIRDRLPHRHLFTLRHEAFLAAPAMELDRLCDFLGLDTTPGYLGACASIVRTSPHHSRHRVSWPHDLRNEVAELVTEHDYLDGYRFDA